MDENLGEETQPRSPQQPQQSTQLPSQSHELHHEDFCRVCRGNGVEERLFHPCKCSGSMKFIHQKCLEAWLEQSKSTRCEICGQRFKFTNVYAPWTPNKIPLYHVLKYLVKKSKRYAYIALRVVLALLVWTVLVPLAALSIWKLVFDPVHLWKVLPNSVSLASDTAKLLGVVARYLFSMVSGPVSSLAASMGGSISPYIPQSVLNVFSDIGYIFMPTSSFSTSSSQSQYLLFDFSYDAVQNLLADIILGQIISISAVVIGLCGFVLKEYIVMNTLTDGRGNPIHRPDLGRRRRRMRRVGVAMDESDSDDDDTAASLWAPGSQINNPNNHESGQDDLPKFGFHGQREFFDASRSDQEQEESEVEATFETVPTSLSSSRTPTRWKSRRQPSPSPSSSPPRLDLSLPDTTLAFELFQSKKGKEPATLSDSEAHATSSQYVDSPSNEGETTELGAHRANIDEIMSSNSDVTGSTGSIQIDASQGPSTSASQRKKALIPVQQVVNGEEDGVTYMTYDEWIAQHDQNRSFKWKRNADGSWTTGGSGGKPGTERPKDEQMAYLRATSNEQHVSSSTSNAAKGPPPPPPSNPNPEKSPKLFQRTLSGHWKPTTAYIERTMTNGYPNEADQMVEMFGGVIDLGRATSNASLSVSSSVSSGNGLSSNPKDEIRKDSVIEGNRSNASPLSTFSNESSKKESLVINSIGTSDNDGTSSSSANKSTIPPPPPRPPVWVPEPEMPRSPLVFGRKIVGPSEAQQRRDNINNVNDNEPTGNIDRVPPAPQEPAVRPPPGVADERPPGIRVEPEVELPREPVERVRPAPRRPIQRIPAVPLANLEAPNFPPANDNDEDEEDFDNTTFLDLLGITGPIEGLVQNALMVVFVIGVAILGVAWLPYLLGRGFWIFFKNVYVPVVNWGVRSVIGVGEFVARVPLTVLQHALERVGMKDLLHIYWVIKESFNSSSLNTTIANATIGQNVTMINVTSDTIESLTNVTALILSNNQTSTLTTTSKGLFDVATGAFKRVISCVDTFGPTHLNISTGWLALLACGYIFLRRSGMLHHPYCITFQTMAKNGTQQFLKMFKIGFFLSVELGVFPVLCGALIDIFTLRVFGTGSGSALNQSATIAARWSFYRRHPWTTIFLHWLAGTIYMFQFAVLIGNVREIVRPGTMWFIRDPNDPHFKPMEDIIHKPVLLQLRKLSIGTIMYAVLILLGAGGAVLTGYLTTFLGYMIVGTVRLLGANIDPALWSSATAVWPLKWDLHEPLSTIPLDFLLIHLLIPYLISWLKPKQIYKSVLRFSFRQVAKRLRLSSFLFGDEHPEEMSDSDAPVRDSISEMTNTTRFRYMRVPKHDHVEVVPGQRMLVPLRDEDAVVGRVGETPEEVNVNWTKCYVPEKFMLRVLAFVGCQWTLALCAFHTLFITPIVLGRASLLYLNREYHLFSMSVYSSKTISESVRPDLPIHDLYSFFTGWIILGSAMGVIGLLYIAAKKLTSRDLIKRAMLEWPSQIRRWSREHGPATFCKIFNGAYLALWLGVILPLCAGLLFDMYIRTPLRQAESSQPPQTPIHLILNNWGIGVLYVRIAYALILLGPDTHIKRAVMNARNLGLAGLSVWTLTKSIFLPVFLMALAGLIGPLVSGWGLKAWNLYMGINHLEKNDVKQTSSKIVSELLAGEDTFLSRYGLRIALLVGIIAEIVYLGWGRLQKIQDRIRDENFLVGRRLHNFSERDDQEQSQEENVAA